MQIESTRGVDPLGVPDGANGLPKAGETRSAAAKAEDTPLPAAEPSLEPYIRQAAEAEEVRADAVAEARRLLDSGALDTADAARAAAENILRLGI